MNSYGGQDALTPSSNTRWSTIVKGSFVMPSAVVDIPKTFAKYKDVVFDMSHVR